MPPVPLERHACSVCGAGAECFKQPRGQGRAYYCFRCRPRIKTRPKCVCCGEWATRTAPVDGRPTPFCDSCPSPAEVIERRNAIRGSWSRRELAARQFDCPLDMVDRLVSVQLDAVVSLGPVDRGGDD